MRKPMLDDRGESLLEVLIAIVILGVCVVAVGSGIALGLRVSDVHRSETTAGAYVRSFAEAIEADAASSTWQGCSATPATYQSPTGFSVPSGYTTAVTSVSYWNGSGFSSTCGSDLGAQQLLLTVSSTDGGATEQLAVVVRKP